MRFLFSLFFVMFFVGCSQEKPNPDLYTSSCKAEAKRKITDLKRIGFQYVEPKLVYFEQIKTAEIRNPKVSLYGDRITDARGEAILHFNSGIVKGEYSCSFEKFNSNVYQFLGRFSDTSRKNEGFARVSIQ